VIKLIVLVYQDIKYWYKVRLQKTCVCRCYWNENRF